MGSAELAKVHKEEIINACAILYETMNFRDITMKEIGNLISLKRPTIYNYFQSKEEIFLGLLQREYEQWADELNLMIESREVMTTDEIASALAHSLEKRGRMLKLFSMNHFDMEANSRLANLTEFKSAYGKPINAVERCLAKFCPDMSDKDRQDFIYSFFPFIYGIFPYTFVTEKQRKAMKDADINFVYLSIYEITYTCAKKLLGVKN
ncbi:MAG: TetR/AcrR family transcriptional regulator [Synergistaceae bacterium]|nr:TetR/AcrR family transcriptional regulator [Synergistaceae bacterium]MBQ6969836.1 TetR/AcrR family transcriptional regulator [Synergistaceae bacterium]